MVGNMSNKERKRVEKNKRARIRDAAARRARANSKRSKEIKEAEDRLRAIDARPTKELCGVQIFSVQELKDIAKADLATEQEGYDEY